MIANSIVVYLNKRINISIELYLIIKLKIIFDFEKFLNDENKLCILKRNTQLTVSWVIQQGFSTNI